MNDEQSLAMPRAMGRTRERHWQKITSGGLLWKRLSALVRLGAPQERWRQVRDELNSWKGFPEQNGQTYQWNQIWCLVDLAQQAAARMPVEDEALDRAFFSALEVDGWDASLAWRGMPRSPIPQTCRRLSVLLEHDIHLGSLAMLEVEVMDNGRGEIYADPQHNWFIAFDTDFKSAYKDAWKWARNEATMNADDREKFRHIDLRFRLSPVSIPYANPSVDRVGGDSAQTAFYLCMLYAAKAYLGHSDARPLDKSVAITASLKSVNDELRLGRVGGLEAKMESAYLGRLKKVIVAKEAEVEARTALEAARDRWQVEFSAATYVVACSNSETAGCEAALLFSDTERMPTVPARIDEKDRPNVAILRNKVRESWIQGVLEQSLHNVSLIDLDIETRPDAVAPWARELERPDQMRQVLPPEQGIGEIFEENHRQLLILGEPGAGKTTTLLELARDLIAVAENDASQPIPVVFNLSTWEKGTSLSDWMVSELHLKYQIHKKLSRRWLEDNYLILLLDGLDEVRPNHRVACVEAINAFCKELGVAGLAVCSREAEYNALSERLSLDEAICLMPLTTDQVNDYLTVAGSRLSALHTTVRTDPILQEMAQTPLMLSTMSLAYRDLSVEDIAQGSDGTEAGRRKHLFDTYIKRMFERRAEDRPRTDEQPDSQDPPYTNVQTIRWLSWLAQRMNQHNQAEFFLEQLQPSWLSTQRQRRGYALNSRLIIGLYCGLFNSSLYNRESIFEVAIVYLISSLIFGLVSGFIDTSIFN